MLWQVIQTRAVGSETKRGNLRLALCLPNFPASRRPAWRGGGGVDMPMMRRKRKFRTSRATAAFLASRDHSGIRMVVIRSVRGEAADT